MKKNGLTLGISPSAFSQKNNTNTFPDGTAISKWFKDSSKIQLNDLGKKYTFTNYGVSRDSSKIQTVAIQKVIDESAANGGGVIILPEGVFLSGTLFLSQKQVYILPTK